MTLEIFSHNSKVDSSYNLGQEIKTEINQLSIIPILSDNIYKDPLSAIRELYFNEVKACLMSKLISRIEIKLDTNSRDLIIQGINSIGITREIFDKILTVMGNSSNSDRSKPGMFGIGFFSHVKISEKMLVHTYTQDEKYFSFISKSGLSFEILPNEYTEKLKNYGTKIIMNVKDAVNLDKLISKIKEIIKLSSIKTDFFVNEINLNVKQYGSLKEILKHDIDFFTNKKKYNTVSTKIYQNSTDLYDIILIKNYPYQEIENESIYLLNVPISFDFVKNLRENNFGYYSNSLNLYLNVKDESLFLPHVSRDYFTKESEIKLTQLIIKDIEKLNEYPIEINNDNNNKINLMDFINDKDRFFKYNLPHIKSKGMNESYMDGNFTRSIITQFENLPQNFDYIINGICFINYQNKKLIKQLYDFGFLCFQLQKNEDPNEYFTGITTIQEALKQNGIKSKIGTIKRKSIKVFKYDNDDKIYYKIKMKYPQSSVSYRHRNIGFTALDYVDASEINEIPIILKDKIFFTSDGYKTIKELRDYELIYTNAIFKKYISSSQKTAFITSQGDIQLISIFFDFKQYDNSNVFELYLESELINDKIKNLIEQDIVKHRNVENIDQLKEILKIC